MTKVSKLAAASFTRPANTTAYAQGDLVANHATAGSVVPLELPVARIMGGAGRITRAAILKSTVTVTDASFRVHLFTDKPVAANGDNAAFSADGRAKGYIGSIEVVVDQALGDGAFGDGAADLVFDASAGDFDIYALIEARAAYAPGNSEVFKLLVDVERDAA